MLFDRDTDTLWYPLGETALDAISGPRAGAKIPFIDKPEIVTLGEWRKQHPRTKVLAPPPPGPKRRIPPGNIE